MSDDKKRELGKALHDAELDQEELDEVAGGGCKVACETGCYTSCSPGNSGGVLETT